MTASDRKNSQSVHAVQQGTRELLAGISEANDLAVSACTVLGTAARRLQAPAATASELLERVGEAAGLLTNACGLLGMSAGKLQHGVKGAASAIASIEEEP
jgi:Co/Zn/Cd efflux system component